MANSSHRFSQFLFISILLVLTCSDCPANTRLPRFYKSQLNLAMMRPERVPASSARHASHYVHNYPIELITRSFSSNIESLISLQKLEVDGITNSINFRAKQIKSQTSILVSLYYTDSNWKNCDLSIVLFDKLSYPGLAFGQVSIANGQKRLQLSTSVKLLINSKDNQIKSITFLNGINVKRNQDTDFVYEIELTDKIDNNAGLFWVTVRVGQNNQLTEINVAYIVYSDGPNYEVYGSYASLENVGSGIHLQYIRDEMPVSNYFLAGISSFKIKKGPGSFYLSFKQKANSQNTIEIQSNEPIQILKLAVFKIGNPSNKLCENCPQKIISNINPTPTCVQACSDGALIQDPIKKISKCLICSSQLNFAAISGKCECLPGFNYANGQCLTAKESNLITENFKPTFSRTDSQCMDPNSYMASDRTCQCKFGYSKKQYLNIFSCQPICNSGFFNGQGCTDCPVGTFPRNELQACLPCCKDCTQCLTEFTCKQCARGFQVNALGQCDEVCGDGIKINVQCDDGNNIDGDGCSARCTVENGFSCNIDGNSKSICSSFEYKVTRKDIKFLSGNLIVEYEILPPPPIYSYAQIQQKIKFKFLKSPPYQSYLAQNPTNPSTIRQVGTYAGIVPAQTIIEVRIELPDGKIFQETINKSFIGNGVLFSRRSINGGLDILK